MLSPSSRLKDYPGVEPLDLVEYTKLWLDQSLVKKIAEYRKDLGNPQMIAKDRAAWYDVMDVSDVLQGPKRILWTKFELRDQVLRHTNELSHDDSLYGTTLLSIEKPNKSTLVEINQVPEVSLINIGLSIYQLTVMCSSPAGIRFKAEKILELLNKRGSKANLIIQ